jgi:rRNA maturation protein Nop10
LTAQTTCPKCGGKAIPVVYGYPTPETEARAARGEVALGGCMIGSGIEPDWRCTQCGHGWRIPRPPRVRFKEGRRALEEALAESADDFDHLRTLTRTIADAGRAEGLTEGHAAGTAEERAARTKAPSEAKRSAADDLARKVANHVKAGVEKKKIADQKDMPRRKVKGKRGLRPLSLSRVYYYIERARKLGYLDPP